MKTIIQHFILLLIIIFLLFIILRFISYLTRNDYIIECFDKLQQTIDKDTLYTTHTVNLPINTNTECRNMCGPNARCYITGHQCLSDIDCPGCQPYIFDKQKNTKLTIYGENASGKLTTGLTPTYSSLTTDIGTESKQLNDLSAIASYNTGINTWKSSFNEGIYIFNKRYKPYDLQFMPDHKKRYTLSGEFIEDGPLPSNF